MTETPVSDSDAFAEAWNEPQKSALSQAELDKLTDDLIEALKKDPNVLSASPNYISHLNGDTNVQ